MYTNTHANTNGCILLYKQMSLKRKLDCNNQFLFAANQLILLFEEKNFLKHVMCLFIYQKKLLFSPFRPWGSCREYSEPEQSSVELLHLLYIKKRRHIHIYPQCFEACYNTWVRLKKFQSCIALTL